MSPRPCLDCGRICDGSRCRACQSEQERRRPQRPTNLTRTTGERKRRAAAVTAHRLRFGDWCPGYGDRPAHGVRPPNVLTADHVTPVARGGDPRGPLTVLCRVCNGSKSDRTGGAREVQP